MSSLRLLAISALVAFVSIPSAGHAEETVESGGLVSGLSIPGIAVEGGLLTMGLAGAAVNLGSVVSHQRRSDAAVILGGFAGSLLLLSSAELLFHVVEDDPEHALTQEQKRVFAGVALVNAAAGAIAFGMAIAGGAQKNVADPATTRQALGVTFAF